MTSEWSPKIDKAWVPIERAATWKTQGVSSPAILNMFGIIKSRPCEAVKVVVSAPPCKRAVDRAGGAALGLHLLDDGDGAPQIRPAFRRPFVCKLRHRRRRRDREDRAHLVDAVGDVERQRYCRRGSLDPVHDRPPRWCRSGHARRRKRCGASGSPIAPGGAVAGRASDVISMAWHGHCSKQIAAPGAQIERLPDSLARGRDG